MSYWDVQSLLAEEQAVKLEFKEGIAGLGFIDSGHRRASIEKDDVVTLPLWQAYNVMSCIRLQDVSGVNEVQMELPHAVSKHYLQFLLSMEDMLKANLREVSPYFHDFCAHLVSLLDLPEARKLKDIQQARAREIIRRVLAIKFNDSTALSLHYLTEDQRQLFFEGFRKVQQVSQWKDRSFYTKQSKPQRKRLKRF